jgi:hypothetical protein
VIEISDDTIGHGEPGDGLLVLDELKRVLDKVDRIQADHAANSDSANQADADSVPDDAGLLADELPAELPAAASANQENTAITGDSDNVDAGDDSCKPEESIESQCIDGQSTESMDSAAAAPDVTVLETAEEAETPPADTAIIDSDTIDDDAMDHETVRMEAVQQHTLTHTADFSTRTRSSHRRSSHRRGTGRKRLAAVSLLLFAAALLAAVGYWTLGNIDPQSALQTVQNNPDEASAAVGPGSVAGDTALAGNGEAESLAVEPLDENDNFDAFFISLKTVENEAEPAAEADAPDAVEAGNGLTAAAAEPAPGESPELADRSLQAETETNIAIAEIEENEINLWLDQQLDPIATSDARDEVAFAAEPATNIAENVAAIRQRLAAAETALTEIKREMAYHREQLSQQDADSEIPAVNTSAEGNQQQIESIKQLEILDARVNQAESVLSQLQQSLVNSQQPVSQPVPQFKTQAESQAELHAVSQPESVAESPVESEAASRADSQPESQSEAQAEALVELGPMPELTPVRSVASISSEMHAAYQSQLASGESPEQTYAIWSVYLASYYGSPPPARELRFLDKAGVPYEIVKTTVNDADWYRVVVNNATQYQAAKQYAAMLKSRLGLKKLWISKRKYSYE